MDSPRFASDWARLAEYHRLMAKHTPDRAVRERGRAEAVRAFEQALALEPELPLAHCLYARLEVDLGMAREATVRLLTLLDRRGPNADAYSGLVDSLRFCGLLEESRTAHDLARSLDPAIVTSVDRTRWLLGGFETEPAERTGEPVETGLADPEVRYYLARTCARRGDAEAALAALARVIDEGYICYPALIHDPWLESLRQSGKLEQLTARARTHQEQAREAFEEADGDRLLRILPPSSRSR